MKDWRSRYPLILNPQKGDSHGIRIILDRFSPSRTRRASEDMLLQRCQFHFGSNHAQIVPFQIVVGNMNPVHVNQCNDAVIPLKRIEA